ncbi:MAG: hypothetical protein GOVbin7368_5 [Prokaryotic dsDNA virus sp.]|nr:MAG: hypothetical protein GOVbin7368_5 [Prokaryotic dsDNA virus sp.]
MKRSGIKRGASTLKRGKPLAARSKKRAAYRASEAGREGLAHMLRVKALPCVICGAPPPSEAHHCRSGGMARDDMATIPLCKRHHTGSEGYHTMKRTWEARYGPDHGFLPLVRRLLGVGQ